DAAVGLDELPEDLLGDAHVLAVVLRRHPQSQQLGAVAFDDLLGRDHVAERLRHLATCAVEREPVRQHGGVRRPARNRDPGEQRAVEPPAVLVAALEVYVGLTELLATLDDGPPARARVEPDVEDVVLAAKRLAAAGGAAHPGRHEVRDRAPEPRVGPFSLEYRRDVRAERLAHERFAAPLAVEGDDRPAPVALAGQAPVRPCGNHVRDPFAAPLGNPPDAGGFSACTAAQVIAIHAEVPLFG